MSVHRRKWVADTATVLAAAAKVAPGDQHPRRVLERLAKFGVPSEGMTDRHLDACAAGARALHEVADLRAENERLRAAIRACTDDGCEACREER